MGEVKRKCQACFVVKDRDSFYKITYSKNEKKLFLNPNSKICGYSIYICKNPTCIDLILRKKIIEKKFSKYNPLNIEIILDELRKKC